MSDPVVSPVQGEAVETLRYRSKPSECQAMQWCGSVGHYSTDPAQIVAWVNANGGEARYVPQGEETIGHPGGYATGWSGYPRIAVRTINGWAYAKPGDYMVMGTATFCVHGDDHDGFCRRDFYPCDPETFERRWEPAGSPSGEAVETDRQADCADPAWLRTLADALASHDPQGIDYRGALRMAADEIERLRRPVAGSPVHEGEDEPHCATCRCGRRAPVQRGHLGGERHGVKYEPHGAGTISWAEHEQAWAVYDARYGGQSAERIAERGGFSYGELVEFLRREPTTWRARS